jgi:hypothetical protein
MFYSLFPRRRGTPAAILPTTSVLRARSRFSFGNKSATSIAAYRAVSEAQGCSHTFRVTCPQGFGTAGRPAAPSGRHRSEPKTPRTNPRLRGDDISSLVLHALRGALLSPVFRHRLHDCASNSALTHACAASNQPHPSRARQAGRRLEREPLRRSRKKQSRSALRPRCTTGQSDRR